VLWGINPRLTYVVGVEITMQTIYLILADLGGTTVTSSLKKEVPRDRNQWFEFYFDTIDKFIRGISKDIKISCIGLSITGPVNKKNGDLDSIGEHYEKGSLTLEENVRTRTGIHTVVNNNANCAALAEYRERITKGYETGNLLYITKHLGLGIIINGNLFYGADGTAGEMGHISVNNAGGSICDCGKRDCLNLFSSPYIMRKRVFEAKTNAVHQRMPVERQSLDSIFTEAVNGAKISQTIVEESGLTLGKAVSTLIELFAPDIVVLQKPSSSEQGNSFFLDRVTEGATRNFSRDGNTIPQIGYSIIEGNADISGATLLAGDEIFHNDEMIQKHILTIKEEKA